MPCLGSFDVGNQNTVRLVRAASDAAAQLVQLRQAEPFGVLNQHHGHVRQVQAHFDNRGRDQDMHSVRAKGGHHALLFLGPKTSVKQTDLKRRELLLQLRPLLDHRLDLALIGFLNARVHHISLPAFLEFAPDELEHLGQRVGGAHKGFDVPAPRGKPVDHRDVEVAVERQAERAWDRRRGHHEQVRITPFPHQLLALHHAELVLFVNDHKAEVVRSERAFDQRVRADEEGVAGYRLSTLHSRTANVEGSAIPSTFALSSGPSSAATEDGPVAGWGVAQAASFDVGRWRLDV